MLKKYKSFEMEKEEKGKNQGTFALESKKMKVTRIKKDGSLRGPVEKI